MESNTLFPTKLERQALGGLAKHPDLFLDIDGHVQPSDFSHRVHEILYTILRDTFFKQENIDKVLIAQKVKELGIKVKDEIDIFDYVETLFSTQITKKATKEACSQLVFYRVRREIYEIGEKEKEHAIKGAESIDEFLAEAESIFNKKISMYDIEDQFTDLYEGIEELIEATGNNPVEEIGLIPPWKIYRDKYGGFDGGNIYGIASRTGEGKSTWLDETAEGTSLLNDCEVLNLNTEMTLKQTQFRKAASLTGVGSWYLKTGQWRKNDKLTKKTRDGLAKLKEKRPRITYHHCGNKNIDQVCSLIRRWYLSRVGRGKKALIIYDYLKLTNESTGNNNAEYQILGRKVDALKRISEELDIPILTACQMNRSGVNKGKKSQDVVDDDSVIASSDRIAWFLTQLFIYRTKTLDELGLDGIEYGTHKLMDIKKRDEGKEATGFFPYIKRNGIWSRNYINFHVENFKVEEKGCLQDIIDAGNHQVTPENVEIEPPADGELTLDAE